jgi:hypothetical protein
MKKIIGILGIMLMLCSVLVFASEMEEVGEDYNGNPYYQQHPLGSLFTVANEHVCAVNPSWSNSGDVTTTELCWRNEDGGSPGGSGDEHPAVVYQVFDYNGGKMGEKTILAGERKCVSGLTVGQGYFRQAFYCDEPQTKCEETYPFYSAGCDYDVCDEGEVKRIRGLREVVDGGCDGWETVACISDVGTGYDCDGDDKTADVSSGSDGSGTVITTTSTLRGEWQNLGHPDVVKPNQLFEVRGTFQALTDGRFYLEAGMLERVYDIVAQGSKCDGSVNFAGEYVDLKAGESVGITFKIVAQEKEGNHNVIVGAYTGCLDDGGEKITSLTFPMKVSSSETVSSSGSGISTGAVAGLGGLTIFGLMIAFVLIIAVLFWMFKK